MKTASEPHNADLQTQTCARIEPLVLAEYVAKAQLCKHLLHFICFLHSRLARLGRMELQSTLYITVAALDKQGGSFRTCNQRPTSAHLVSSCQEPYRLSPDVKQYTHKKKTLNTDV